MFYRKYLKKGKKRAELFDYDVATVMSKVTHIFYGLHGVDTTDVYVLLVRFALAHLNINV